MSNHGMPAAAAAAAVGARWRAALLFVMCGSLACARVADVVPRTGLSGNVRSPVTLVSTREELASAMRCIESSRYGVVVLNEQERPCIRFFSDTESLVYLVDGEPAQARFDACFSQVIPGNDGVDVMEVKIVDYRVLAGYSGIACSPHGGIVRSSDWVAQSTMGVEERHVADMIVACRNR